MKNEIKVSDAILQRCASKVLLERDNAGLMNITVAKYLDIQPGEVSCIQRDDKYMYVCHTSRRKIHDWYNSGMSLAEWYNKRIKESEREDTSEQPDETLGTMNTETIPEVRRTAPPKPEPAPEEGKPPTEQKPPKPKEEKPAAPPPPPIPEQTHAGDAMTIEAQTRKIVIEPKPKGKPGRKPRDKGEGSPYGKYEKPAPSQEEIERVLATLGIEIAIVVKLKNKQD